MFKLIIIFWLGGYSSMGNSIITEFNTYEQCEVARAHIVNTIMKDGHVALASQGCYDNRNGGKK